MERPSHIIFAPHSRSHRLPFIGLALSLQAAAVWMFVHGLSDYRIPDIIRDIQVAPIPDKETTERAKPPEPVFTKPEPVIVDRPIFDVDRNGDDGKSIHANTEQKPVIAAPRPVVPDHAPVSIAATHTAPPYPPIARRIGAEGKVTLRLTVTPEGRVAQARIVASSGRDDLDQTAQAWIVAHWTYRPASHDGQPIIGQATATVVFSLTN